MLFKGLCNFVNRGVIDQLGQVLNRGLEQLGEILKQGLLQLMEIMNIRKVQCLSSWDKYDLSSTRNVAHED